MIARLIEWSVHNRALVLVLAVMLTVAGVWAARNTPVDAIPDLSDVQVIVVTEVPGQAPEIVDDQVTYPLATALLSVPYARDVRGYSFFGLSMVYVIFEDGTDLYWARSRVLEYLDGVGDRLPDGVTPQIGPDATGVGWVYEYSLSDFSPRARVLRDQLDADGDGVVSDTELPEPKGLAVVGARDVCSLRLLGRCWRWESEGGHAVHVYEADQLQALFAVDDPPLGHGPERFRDDSVRYLLEGFDRDGDDRINPLELGRAANFMGLDLAQLRSIQDWYLRYDLTSIDGVSEVASVGGFVRQYQVEVDPEKLRAFGVTLSQVRTAIQRANQDAGGRILEQAETEFMVRGQGYIRSIDDLQTVPVSVDPDTHTPVLLRQVAHVSVGPAPRRGLVDMDGQGEVVTGIVLQRYGENALEVIERVRTRLDELKPGLPEGVEVHVSYDRSELITEGVTTLRDTLLEQIVIVTAICALFLLNLRSSVVAVTILPLGIGGALLLMNVLGINANIMSLGGIAIAIGDMIDASVVMVENAHKHRERRPDAPLTEVVIAACREVGPALFLSLMIITISFLPVLTLQQQEGRLFRPLALTKTFAMLASALLAVTLIPALLATFMKGTVRAEGDNWLTMGLRRLYTPVLQTMLRRPVLLVVAIVGLIAASAFPASQLGREFMPPLNEGDLLYMPTTPPGMSITKAKELLQQTDRMIATHPQVRHVLGKVGRAETATDPAPLTMIETTILLEDSEAWPPGKTIEDIISELDAMVQIPGLTNAWTMPIRTRIDMLATGIKTPVGIKLLGDDLEVLSEVGTEVEAVIADLPGVTSVYSERVVGGNYVDIQVRRPDAARFGLNVADVQDVVRTAIGGMAVTETVEGLERYDVTVRFPRDLRSDLEDLRRVAVATPMGHTVPLGQVADIGVSKGPPAIKSENARRTAWIFVTLDTGDLGGFVQRARRAVDASVQLPPGVSLEWSGQYTYMQRANERLMLVLPLTLTLVFLLLYAYFRQLPEVGILMVATLLVAPVGGLWWLYLAGYNLSVAVGVGFIALIGLAAQNGVVMLVYLQEAVGRYAEEDRLHTWSDLQEAVTEGAAGRLRPILMTAGSDALALMPVLFAVEAGSRTMKRIAAPMVGGLLSATLLSLLVMPVLYALVKRRQVTTGTLHA